MSNSKPLGQGTRNLTSNVTDDLYGKIDRLARTSGCKLGEYVRAVMEDAVAQGIIVRDNPADIAARELALAQNHRPLPKVGKQVAREGDRIYALRVAEPAASDKRARR